MMMSRHRGPGRGRKASKLWFLAIPAAGGLALGGYFGTESLNDSLPAPRPSLSASPAPSYSPSLHSRPSPTPSATHKRHSPRPSPTHSRPRPTPTHTVTAPAPTVTKTVTPSPTHSATKTPSPTPDPTSGNTVFGKASFFGGPDDPQSLACGGSTPPKTVGVALWNLPCGTPVTIHSLQSGRTVVATVVDRGPGAGPTAHGVVIDLLEGTWDALGVSRSQGLQQVSYSY